jgi:site-specific DNA recombinase
MRAVGYARVSSDQQAEEGCSLGVQRQKIKAYTRVKDWTLIDTIEDAGMSAKDTKRPGLARVLALVEARKVDVVIVAKLDRLTRSVADLDKLMKLFRRQKVALVSLAESLDATTATGELMMNLLASVSQWERKVIGERTSAVLQHKKANREKTGGVTRYGWRLAQDGKHVEPHAGEQAIIKAAKALKERGLSLRQIGMALAEQGYRPRQSKTWLPQTIANLLTAEVVESQA